MGFSFAVNELFLWFCAGGVGGISGSVGVTFSDVSGCCCGAGRSSDWMRIACTGESFIRFR